MKRMGTDRNFNANGVELQSPASRSARWVTDQTNDRTPTGFHKRRALGTPLSALSELCEIPLCHPSCSSQDSPSLTRQLTIRNILHSSFLIGAPGACYPNGVPQRHAARGTDCNRFFSNRTFEKRLFLRQGLYETIISLSDQTSPPVRISRYS